MEEGFIMMHQSINTSQIEFLFSLSNVYEKNKMSVTNEINIDTLVGQIITNRIVGIAFLNLHLNNISREIRKMFDVLTKENKRAYERFMKNLSYISYIFKNADFEYALLKGAFLISSVYAPGCRLSNDIDVLVRSKDVSKIQGILIKNGFIQGQFDPKNKHIVPANRRDIIEAKINFGETIPFIKICGEHPLVLDINFSLDFKPDKEGKVDMMLEKSVKHHIGKYDFLTLNEVDFLIHLSCHLYKEATTFDWVQWRRDLELYKFSDINVIMHKYGTESYFSSLASRIKELNLEKECYYTFENSSLIYPALSEIDGFIKLKEAIAPKDLTYLKQITHPIRNTIYNFDMNFKEWFACLNRVEYLQKSF